jgi:hypothetical protein
VSTPEETAAGAEATAAGPAAKAPEDADDLRGFHFKRLLRKPLTLAAIGAATIAAGVAGAALLGPAFGGAGAVLAFLVGLLVVFWIADSEAADAFFQSYAQAHGLALGGRASLPAATPLLCKGSKRYATRTLTGAIAEGIEGTLALYTYEEQTTSGQGGSETSYYNYTLVLAQVPECVAQVPELFCQRRVGPHALERFEDAFRRSKERVKLESEVLDDRYEIFAGKGQDAVWLHRLFSPGFIVWLTDSTPKKFGFELLNGTLCCYVNGHKEDSEDLDTIAAAAATVAKRLREESTE